jgi:teichuronic acid exporter
VQKKSFHGKTKPNPSGRGNELGKRELHSVCLDVDARVEQPVNILVHHAKVRSAVGWSVLEIFVRQGLGFVISIVLARILAPEDFGIIAMLAIFLVVASLFIDSGFSQALIQRQGSTHVDESTIFFFNLGMGGLVALVLCLCASWIAGFYHQPILREITFLMAFNLMVNACGSIHTALLSKALDFKTLAKSGVAATLLSGTLAIIMALAGWGVWSLVWQTIVSSLVMVAMLWSLHPWRPQWVFSLASLRSYFRFGGFLLLTGVLNNAYLNLNSLVIGKLYSSRDVGFYSRAQNLQQLPVTLLTSMVGRIAYPVFSQTADDKERLARGMRKAQAAIMLVNIPLMMVFLVLAEPLVLALLGSKWSTVIPVLQILSVGGILWPLNALNLNVLKAQGHSDLNVRILLVKMLIGISLLALASTRGILAIAYAQALASILAFFINAHYSRVFLNYGAWSQLKDLLPLFAAAVPAGLGMWLVVSMADLPAYAELVLAAGAGGVLYLGACHLLHVSALAEMLRLLQSRHKLSSSEI